MANDDIIQVVRPRLLGLLAEGEKLAVLDHPGVKGRLREILVQSMIEPFLPPLVKVRTGTIVAPFGGDDPDAQYDLVLFSLEKAPLLRHLGEQSIIPIGGVLAHIEVKSTLKRDDLRKAVKAASKLRDLAVREAPASIIFAYNSDFGGDEVARLLEVLKEVGFEAHPGQATSPIQLICVATKGTWMLIGINGKEGWWEASTEEEHHLLAFCSILSNYCYLSEKEQPGVGDYLLDTNWLKGPSPECPLVVHGTTGSSG